MPGTETRLTPETEEPNIPNATAHHGERLSPRKNALLSPRPPVLRATAYNSAK